jgi:hypothetical protein
VGLGCDEDAREGSGVEGARQRGSEGARGPVMMCLIGVVCMLRLSWCLRCVVSPLE